METRGHYAMTKAREKKPGAGYLRCGKMAVAFQCVIHKIFIPGACIDSLIKIQEGDHS